MPLSDHEQRLLEQMEEALYAEDPKFATQLGSDGKAAARKRLILGVVGGIVGLALVVIGVITMQIWLGGIGFAVMVAGGAWALTPPRGSRAGLGAVGQDGSVNRTYTKSKGSRQSKGRGRQGRPKGGQGTFMQRLEQRWDRRREGGY